MRNDFESDATGSYTSPMGRFVGFVDGLFEFDNVSGLDVRVVNSWGPSGNRSLTPDGDPVELKITARIGTSTLPTEFTMALGAYNGTATVAAYDASSNLIWSQGYPANGDYIVTISGKGAIDHVMVLGGDQEVFIDNVCIQ